MIPIIDWVYSKYKNSKFGENKSVPEGIIVIKIDDKPIRNICVIPDSILQIKWLSKMLLPKIGTNFIFPVSAQYHITEDAGESLRRISRVYERSREAIIEGIKNKKNITIMGVSLGCVIATRLASEYSCKELRLVVPGDRLGECAQESSLTGPVVRRAESIRDYCETLRVFDPITHVDRIRTEIIKINIGGRDLLIPARRGRIIAKAMKKSHPDTRVKYYWWADHFMTILMTAVDRRNG